ncbi:MAG: HNH endonuclease [Candidatus Bipolaricaulia bacterium]
MKSKSDGLKLTIELVPSTSWYNNLRKYTSKKDWDKIRKRIYAEYGHRCGICGAEGRLNCHEIWEYDNKKHMQKLIGFIALCDMCHHVKHIGLAGILASEGKLDYGKVVEHFMRVNKCNEKTFEEHREKAFDEWHKRSQHEWHVDLGEYKDVIKSVSTS